MRIDLEKYANNLLFDMHLGIVEILFFVFLFFLPLVSLFFPNNISLSFLE